VRKEDDGVKNNSNELKLPAAISGPAQLVLYTRYDDPRAPGWDSKWITNWHVHQLHPWFPGREIKMHKHFWPLLQDAFLELGKLGLHSELKSCSSCHELASVPGSPVLSVHSWGAAKDLNPADNPKGTIGSWSDDFLSIMESHSIHCGQR